MNSTPFLSHSPQPYSHQHFENHPQFWQSGDNSVPTTYSNVSITPQSATFSQSSQQHTHPFQMGTSQADFGWPPPHAPMRSMSVGGPEEHSYQPYYQEQYPSIRRSMTSMSDIQVGTGMHSSNVAAPTAHTQSPTGILHFDDQNRSHPGQYRYLPQWSSAPTAQIPHLGSTVHDLRPQGWFTPSPHLPDVREEDFHQRSHPP